MPFNVKHDAMVKKVSEKTLGSLRTSGRKTPGTRIGTMIDWRGAAKSGKLTDRYGRSLRNGK